MKTAKIGAMLLVSLLVCNHVCLAGDLNPPLAPAPTMKTLDEVEPRIPIDSLPFTINASGSYYLTACLSSTTTGIHVNCGDVTIDMKGFTITGPGDTGSVGINLYGNHDNIHIFDGTIKSFSSGISAGTSTSDAPENITVKNVKFFDTSEWGLYLFANSCIITDCSFFDGKRVMYVRNNSIIKNNTIKNFTLNGIQCYENNIVHNNTINRTTNYAICATDGTTVSGNTVNHVVYSILNYAIKVSDYCIVKDNIVRMEPDAKDDDCTGIYTGVGCLISGNVITDCLRSGIFVSHRSKVVGNNISMCGHNGISASGQDEISQNIICESGYVTTYPYYGIATSFGNNLIRDNHLVANGLVSSNIGGNIHVMGKGNCVIGNLVNDAKVGLQFFYTTGNFFAENRATNNTTDFITGSNTDGGNNYSF